MATNYDVMFLRILIEDGRLSREQGLQCLQRIDQSSPPPNAASVSMQLGIDERSARAVHERVMAHFATSGEQVSPVSREEAVRGVSGEVPALPESPEAPYFDLTHMAEGVDDYLLGPVIQHGTCYSSYRGKDPRGNPVRILTLSSRFESYPEIAAEVAAELQGWRGFQHRGGSGPLQLGRTLPKGDRPAQTIVIYPEAEGQLLSELLRSDGPLPSEEALEIVLDLAELMAAAHPKGLALGDLRSDAIRYDGERATLVDIGLARANSVAGGFASAGVPFGHPGYLAPEVIQERQARPTPASDVYALGILFYELICGVLPFQGSPLEQLEQHFATPLPPPPAEVSFSTTTAGVILRMTAKTTDERAQDTVSLAKALDDFRQGRAFRIPVGPVVSVPLGAEPVSQDAWTDGAAKAAEGNDDTDWTESMLDVPGVGPSELQPLASGTLDPIDLAGVIPLGPVSQRLPREMRARLLAEAASDLEPTIPEPKEAPAQALAQTPAPAPAPVQVEVEAKVQIGEKLGRGAVGATYEGVVPGREGPLVLKAISRKFVKHTEILEQVRAELRAATKVVGPHVVQVVDVMLADERDLIVSERSRGETLKTLLDKQPRQSLDQVVSLARDLSQALRAGLEVGLSHGDIRPEKIYIETGRARLADFGHAGAACLGAGLGKYGLYFGHPYYLAPEVVQKRQELPSLSSDLYALGVVLYQALCGVVPFKGQGIRKTLFAQIKQPLPPPPEDMRVPSAFAELIIHLTAKDPRARIASLDELEDRLDSCLEASMASADGFGGASGLASALTVEEFDPLASSMGDEAREAWGTRSQEMVRPPGEWNREKIREAGNSSPAWGGPKVTTGELYADLEKGALGAAVAQASKAKERGSARTKKKKAEEEGGNAVFWIGGGLLGLIVVSVSVAILAKEEDKKPPPSPRAQVSRTVEPHSGGSGTQPPATPSAGAAEVKAALDTFESEFRSLVASGNFAAAEALTLPESLKKNQSAVALRGKLVADARAQARKKLNELKPRYQSFLDDERLSEARELVTKAEAWAPEALISAWKEEVGRRLQAEEDMLKGLRDRLGIKGGETDPKRILNQVRLPEARAYPNGGVVAQYSRGREMLTDLKILRRKGLPETGDAPSGVQGVTLTGSRSKPGVLAWRPPLQGLHRLKLRIEARGATGAILLGMGPKGEEGLGISFGGNRAELTRRRLDRAKKTPALDGPLELELKLGGSGRPRVEGTVGGKSYGYDVAPDRVGGMVGLAVDGGEVWLLKLEVWGIAQ